jgi:hypothetical protein
MSNVGVKREMAPNGGVPARTNKEMYARNSGRVVNVD